MEKYSKDGVVLFKESNHTYTNVKTGKKLKSVTSFINECSNPFDIETHSQNTANDLFITKEEVQEMWKGKGLNSTEMGTYVHLMFENFYNKLPYPPNERYHKSYVALGIIRKYFETGMLQVQESELIVYNNHLAGQIDNISRTSKGLFIIDFKTNNEISKQNYGKYLGGVLKPLRIPDSTYHKYSLQLSIYKVMHKIQIDGLQILHIQDKGYKFEPAIDYSEQLKLLDIFK